jgi:hypothetical protein
MERMLLQHDAGVGADHPLLVHHVREPPHRAERGRLARSEIRPVEPDRVVAGKEAAVVPEHDQSHPLDLRVGRVDVGAVDRAGLECRVRQLVLDPHDPPPVEAVHACEPGESVLPPQEFVREP